jgi:large subunit ribosomal protein L10
VVLAKALSTWVKDNAEFTFKLAIVDGKVLSVAEIGELATMPGKEELFSKLLFLINSPAQRLATVINATGRDLAVVINQAVEKEKFSAGAAPAAAPVAEAAPAPEAPVAEPEIAAAHAEEAPTPAEAIAAHPESEADAVAETPAQPENGTASQAGEAANTEPAEG